MNRAELLELLKKARKQLKKYHVPENEQTVRLSLDTLENVLSEQPEIVRCKDCKYRHDSIWCSMFSEGMDTEDDWFCADGENE